MTEIEYRPIKRSDMEDANKHYDQIIQVPNNPQHRCSEPFLVRYFKN